MSMGRPAFHFPWVIVMLGVSGCAAAAAPVPAQAPSAEPTTDAEPVSQTTTLAAAVPTVEEPEPIPTTCEEDGKLCLLPATYAKKLCGGIYPEIALGMFAKGTPFTRIYLAGD